VSEPPVDADAFNAFEAEGWESKAAGYDGFFGRITGRVVEPLLDAAEVGPGTRVLDVATGPGYAAALAAERGASVVGMDVAEEMVSLAARLHPDLEFRQGNAEALPFPDEAFHAVVSNFGLLHLGHPERAASEFARVLDSGGSVALTVWDLPERTRLLGVFLDAVARAGATAPEDIPVGPPFFHFSDDGEFVRLLADVGLEEPMVRTLSFVQSIPSPDDLWRGMLGGTVRTSALILRQPDDIHQRIRAAFDRIVQQYAVGDHLELPVAVKLASARKI
jgi:ubiquinone/menaquinone biosynthesis C-methylase UbiE